MDGPITPLCTPPPGSFFPRGTTFVSCSAVDRTGHAGFATCYVHVSFGGPPIVPVPNPLTVRSSSLAGRVVTYPSTALDLLGRTLPTDCSPRRAFRLP